MSVQENIILEVPNLRKFAMRLTKNVSDAEDLLQSTVLRALEKHGYFQEGTNLFSWSSKIMFNIFVSQYRHKKKFETQHDPAPYLDEIVTASSQEACTDLATVQRTMETLSREHREILLLVCIQGLRYEEVAEQLNIPVGTVRSRLSRARQQLQEALAPKPVAGVLYPVFRQENLTRKAVGYQSA
jgi:RNA polymerase sigma-70 factor (ECF subfamily)